jgi:signal transduction histidine kinase
MGETVWYRSLYWRIALGFVALLATLLVVQVLVFLWMTGRMPDLFPSRTSAQLAAAIAEDLSDALTSQPAIDVESYVTERYSSSHRGYVVVLSTGAVIVSPRVPPPQSLARAARGRLLGARPGGGPDPFSGRRDFGGRGGRGRDEWGRGGGRGSDRGGDRGPGLEWGAPLPGGAFGGGPGGPAGPGGVPSTEYANVVVNGEVVGVVAVPQEPPPLSLALRDLGPTLAVVALSLLSAGTAVAALVIFRPTRRRLHELQKAARALGAGELAVRAPESGYDEVTALSRAFNDMATQLELRTQALENADRTRRRLLADVSHELSTPLSAIRGYVETLGMRDLPLDEATRQRYLRIVNDESERLEHIIGDLLDLARLEGGGGSWRVEPVAVSHLLERVRHRHAPAVAEKQITLTTWQDPRVGELQGDQNRLEQALQNLVANAIRHTPTGGRVAVSAMPGDEAVILRVDDTGPGIPPEHLPHVFDRFYKVDQSRTGTPLPSGSGLGLSIVQAIVMRHGGTVQASNRSEGGARVEMSLPVVPGS